MAAPDAVDFTNLDQLAELIKAADPDGTQIRAVSTEPTEVEPPGVWVRVDGVGPHTLAAVTIRTTLHLVVPDLDTRRSLDQLAALYNLIKPVLDPIGGITGPVSSVGLVLPGSPKPLPCFAVPFDMLTSPTT